MSAFPPVEMVKDASVITRVTQTLAHTSTGSIPGLSTSKPELGTSGLGLPSDESGTQSRGVEAAPSAYGVSVQRVSASTPHDSTGKGQLLITADIISVKGEPIESLHGEAPSSWRGANGTEGTTTVTTSVATAMSYRDISIGEFVSSLTSGGASGTVSTPGTTNGDRPAGSARGSIMDASNDTLRQSPHDFSARTPTFQNIPPALAPPRQNPAPPKPAIAPSTASEEPVSSTNAPPSLSISHTMTQTTVAPPTTVASRPGPSAGPTTTPQHLAAPTPKPMSISTSKQRPPSNRPPSPEFLPPPSLSKIKKEGSSPGPGIVAPSALPLPPGLASSASGSSASGSSASFGSVIPVIDLRQERAKRPPRNAPPVGRGKRSRVESPFVVAALSSTQYAKSLSPPPHETPPFCLRTPEELAVTTLADPSAFPSLDACVAEQQALPPQARSITGPELAGEFDYSHTVHVNKSAARFQHVNNAPLDMPHLTELFENMIYEENVAEFPRSKMPEIRIVPDSRGPPYSPPFEIIYTNRCIYRCGVVPLPARGCGCRGNCGDPSNIDRCSCRRRQERASATVNPAEPRTNRKGFAYTPEGLIHSDVLENQEVIWECNARCGCGDSCINRVVGARRSLSVDIFWTGSWGWGVRSARSNRVIMPGTPLAVYSGELITLAEAERREEMSRVSKRCYIFDLDSWSIGEDAEHWHEGEEILSQLETHTMALGTVPVAADDSDTLSVSGNPSFEAKYAVDAQHYGNWTRFCNHTCARPNAVARAIQVDDGNIYCPLIVFIAQDTIHPGEEIKISYNEGMDAGWKEGKTIEEIKAVADKRRKAAEPHLRCYCGYAECAGVMFGG